MTQELTILLMSNNLEVMTFASRDFKVASVSVDGSETLIELTNCMKIWTDSSTENISSLYKLSTIKSKSSTMLNWSKTFLSTGNCTKNSNWVNKLLK
ncbi:hypothetical protein WICPIJ_003829 [Wickerhamomyces pijperi]|uniref:Uncharacterized protein n=1 Tax=Wickerhamomyces pijperi TaxID=599730 RepID=A0A9P8Q8W5_WICPI|nr:hypothetical protein WICPIJ_003829 [Wickerhamomyces pijperi]